MKKNFKKTAVTLAVAGFTVAIMGSAGAAMNEKRVLRKMGGPHTGYITGVNKFKNASGQVYFMENVDKSRGKMKIPVKPGTAKTKVNDPDHGTSQFKGKENKLDVKRNGKLATGRVKGSMTTPGGGVFKGKLKQAKVVKRGRKTTATTKIDSEADQGGGFSRCFVGKAKGKGRF